MKTIHINTEKIKENREKADRLIDTTSDLKPFEGIDVEADWNIVKVRMGLSPRMNRIPLPRYLLRIAAILIMALGLVYLFNLLIKEVPTQPESDYYQVVAQNGNRIVNLPDGSVVTLKAHSELVYNSQFGKENRDVILEGEAFFEVHRNEAVPFKVFASEATIEVLGTAFNVKSTNEVVEVGVVTGHVAMFETANKKNRTELLRNEMGTFLIDQKQIQDKEAFNANALAWRTGILKFRQAPLHEVFITLAECYDKKLELNLQHELTETLTATFRNQSLEDIFEMIDLSTMQTFNYQLDSNRIFISN